MRARAILRCATLFAVLLPAAHAAAEAPSAAEILGKMDRMMNGFEDQSMEVRLTIVDVDGSRKSYEFSIWQKGDERRLLKFTSGEMKGMATLIQDRNNMYVYLPGFKKVRRVAAHNMNQSFAGSDFSNEDMASVSWTKVYDVKFVREDAEAWYLLATPKPGEKIDYAKVELKIDKKHGTQLEAVYYNKAGEKVKRFDDADLKMWDGIPRAGTITVSDPRTGHKTIMELKTFKVDQKLPDEMFTERFLYLGK